MFSHFLPSTFWRLTVEKYKVSAMKAENGLKLFLPSGTDSSLLPLHVLCYLKKNPNKTNTQWNCCYLQKIWEVPSQFQCLKQTSASETWKTNRRKSEPYTSCSLFYCKIKCDNSALWQAHCTYQFELLLFNLLRRGEREEVTGGGVRHSYPEWPPEPFLTL